MSERVIERGIAEFREAMITSRKSKMTLTDENIRSRDIEKNVDIKKNDNFKYAFL